MKPIPTHLLLKHIFFYCYPKENRKVRLAIWLALFILILGKLSMSLSPLLFKEALNKLTAPGEIDFSYPLLLMVLYGVSYFVGESLTNLKDMIFIPVEMHAVRSLALGLFKHIHRLSYDYHIHRRTGKLTTIFERGIASLERFLRFVIFSSFPMFFEIIFVFSLLIGLYKFQYAAVIFITLVCYFVFTIKIANWRTRQVRALNIAYNESTAHAVDSLLNFETVKIFNREAYDYKAYEEKFGIAQALKRKVLISRGYLNIGQAAIIGSGIIMTMILGFKDLQRGLFGVGDLALLNMYLIQLYGLLSNLGFSYREMKMALTDMEQVEEIMEEPILINDQPNAKPLRLMGGTIQFQEVSFHYPSRKETLKKITFTVSAKQKVAVVGQSGAGKSTLTRLLLRFYEPTSGKITIDNQDTRLVTLESLREAIGIVPQDIVLLNSTLYQNIAFGRPDATPEEVEKAAKDALIHEFIISLPNGYQTLVGERGLKLSGGEKQRVAIARVILKQPEIFVFDEATSSLDTRTEKEIHENISLVSQNYTTLIIAHRLSTVSDADLILFMEKGEIVERGTHTQLIDQKGRYYTLWEAQKKKKPLGL